MRFKIEASYFPAKQAGTIRPSFVASTRPPCAGNLHADVSWWVVPHWTVDARLGIAPLVSAVLTAGPTFHVGPAADTAPSGRAHRQSVSYLFGVRGGAFVGLYGSCLESDPPQCTPPEHEWIVGADVGIAKRFSSVDLRLLVGLDYRWGKLPAPRENRPGHDGPWRPQVSVAWLWR